MNAVVKMWDDDGLLPRLHVEGDYEAINSENGSLIVRSPQEVYLYAPGEWKRATVRWVTQ